MPGRKLAFPDATLMPLPPLVLGLSFWLALIREPAPPCQSHHESSIAISRATRSAPDFGGLTERSRVPIFDFKPGGSFMLAPGFRAVAAAAGPIAGEVPPEELPSGRMM